MKKFKIVSRLFILVFFLLITASISINLFASSKEYNNGYAVYKDVVVTDEKDLGYGVKWHRETATSKVLQSKLAINGQVGIDYAQRINVLEFSLNDEVSLVPYAVLNGALWSAVSVKKAAEQYELDNPGYRVIAAVNGDFFAINNDLKASTGVTVSQGEFYKTVSGHGAVNTLAIKNNGEGKQLFMTNTTDTVPTLSIYNDNDEVIKKIVINKVNEEPGENEVSLYYPTRIKNYTEGVNTIDVVNAWIVTGKKSVTTVKNSFYGKGSISKFATSTETLVDGRFAVKSNNEEINKLLGENVTIRCQYEYTDSAVQGVENFIGVPWQIISNGEPAVEFVNNGDNISYRHPRTIVGQKENGEIVLAVVDGRQASSNMNGVCGAEMAALMSYYGCVDAWNLDGGGSTTMLVRKLNNWSLKNVFKDSESSQWYITNSPSDGNERNDGNHLFVVVKVPEITVEISDVDTTFIQFNIALISDIEKYSNLYVLVNDKFYPVENDMVKITGLMKNSNYKLLFYYKVDDTYYDLMTEYNFSTNKGTPSQITAYVSLNDKGGVEYVFINYNIDDSAAVTKIILKADKDYKSITQSVFIEKTEDFYKALTNAGIEIYYQLNDIFDEEVLNLNNIDFQFTCDYIIDEMLLTSNNYYNNIFK